jgi:hypothetical protein
MRDRGEQKRVRIRVDAMQPAEAIDVTVAVAASLCVYPCCNAEAVHLPCILLFYAI